MSTIINFITNLVILSLLFFGLITLFYVIIPDPAKATDLQTGALLLIEVLLAVFAFIKIYKWVNSLKWYQKL